MNRREFVKAFSALPLLGVLRRKKRPMPLVEMQKEIGGDTKYPIGVIYDGADGGVVLGIVSANELLDSNLKSRTKLKTDFITDIRKSFEDDGKFDWGDISNRAAIASITPRKSEEILGFLEDHGFDISKAYMVMHPGQYRHIAYSIALEYQDIAACQWDMMADKVLKLYGYRVPVIRTREMPEINGRQVRMIILTSKSLPFPEDKWHNIGDWKCKFCHNVMARHRVRCEVCGEYRSLVV